MLRFHDWGMRQPFLQRRKNFDALDRIDSQIGVEPHVEIEHLRRVSRLFRHGVEEQFLHVLGVPIAIARRSSRSCGRNVRGAPPAMKSMI